MSQNPAFDKLVRLLKELFQLDQPDLDFGLYRIMHARAEEISRFLDRDLLPQVQEAFSQHRTADKADLEKELQQAIEQANDLGVDPESTAKAKDLRKKISEQGVDVRGLEHEVYDHLYKFFRRYYHEGDFLAKRVYKPGVYAIPYEGEEVKLHWANKDQYYIKTSEHLRDYTFVLKPEAKDNPMRVHFRLVDVAEGEHGNIKSSEDQNRVFILARENFITEEDGESGNELVIRFEYRPASLSDWSEEAKEQVTAAAKKKPPLQKVLREDAVRRVLAVQDENLKPWLTELAKNHIKASGELADYSRLAGHLARYTARNTFDYFIHKNLGSFLRRELDFYIKNEVMHLDDIESESAPRVEQYLSKIKVIRQIAGKIIDFLAQLENFQKKLWLKKKFVTKTSWCIRVGCIPEDFYPEIVDNEAQLQEWIDLYAIDGIQSDIFTAAYSEPLTSEFLKTHPTLIVDTHHFDENFSVRLIEAMGDIDDRTDGVLFHSENFQSLNFIRNRLKDKVKNIYIDPPYNTGSDEFVYKDAYQSSSWAQFIFDRAGLARELLSPDGLFLMQVGDDERASSRFILDEVFPDRKNTAIVRRGIKNVQAQFEDISRLNVGHDVVHIYSKTVGLRVPHLKHFHEMAKPGKWDTFWRSTDRPTMRYNLFNVHPARGQWRWEEGRAKKASKNYQYYLNNEAEGKSLDEWYVENLQSGTDLDFVRKNEDGVVQYYVPPQGYRLVSDNWLDVATAGSSIDFATEKNVQLLDRVISWNTVEDDWALDFFAGSGSLGEAAIRSFTGRKRFILMEMGDHFDTVLLPRLKKVTFSPEWKNGKPKRMATDEEAERSPRMMKVIRLESYEDTLNNLDLRRSEPQDSLLQFAEAQGPDGLREQYLLRYMLDVETRGSQSLLNIAAFTDPTAYRLKVKRPGSEETRETNVDLLETFNWLIGLTVESIAAPQTVTAAFKRENDPDQPKDAPCRLLIGGTVREDSDGPWWFRTVSGTTPNGRKTLVIWRKLTGNQEQDNLVLDEWFKEQGYSSKNSEFDLIYVNGDNNLENLRQPDDTWKVCLIEEDFHRLMFEEAEA